MTTRHADNVFTINIQVGRNVCFHLLAACVEQGYHRSPGVDHFGFVEVYPVYVARRRCVEPGVA